jgi:hypothetical protein
MIGRFFVLSGRRHAAGTLPSGRTLSSCRSEHLRMPRSRVLLAAAPHPRRAASNNLAIRILRASSMRALGIRSSYKGRMVNA